MIDQQTSNFIDIAHELGKTFASRAEQKDRDGQFVFENYQDLKEHQFFSAAIPLELGGGGLSHDEMCDVIKTFAHYCSSTALAFSMHQHLVAASVWKYQNQGQGAELLKQVSLNQLVLVSTGARDWLGSNGEMVKVEGGYLFSAKKSFASQAPAGNIAITSCPYLDKDNEWKVLHFPVPLNATGVSIAEDWDVMGMRATGSQSIHFDRVFVPDSAIALSRPKDEFHPVWGVVLTVALPLIMSAYVGIAEKAFEIALNIGKKYSRNSRQFPFMLGKMNNSLLSAQTQWQALKNLANGFEFKPNAGLVNKVLSYKTNISEDCKSVVAQAMECIGGQSFYRSKGLERLFRDVQASPFHPLPKWEQYLFTGNSILEG